MRRNKDILLLALEKSTALQLSLTIYVLLRLVKEAESMIGKRRGSVCVCVCVFVEGERESERERVGGVVISRFSS